MVRHLQGMSAAAQHEMGLARAPKTLPAAARNAVFRSLIKNNLLTEINAPREHVGLGWRQDDDGTWIVARITDEGLRAIGIDPNEGDAVAHALPAVAPEAEPAPRDALAAEAAQAAPLTHQPTPAGTTTKRISRELAQGLLAAARDMLVVWEGTAHPDLAYRPGSPAARLRDLLAQAETPQKPSRIAREPGAPRKPREGTKQEQVLALLRREEGATIAQICEATGWQGHTVRGFFAGLKKRQGMEVHVLERVRQVGPNKEGARGSYTVYHLPA
jgi:hypothetical protein